MEGEIPRRSQYNLSVAVCLVARSGIIAALYLAAFLAALQLAAVLPEPWSATAVTALILVAALALRGKWPGRELRLESVGLGYQPKGKPNPQPAMRALPDGMPARSRPALNVVSESTEPIP